MLVPSFLFEPQEDGSLYLPLGLDDIKRHGTYGYHEAAPAQPEVLKQQNHSVKLATNGHVKHVPQEKSVEFSAPVEPVVQAQTGSHPLDSAAMRESISSEAACRVEPNEVVIRKTMHEHKQLVDQPVMHETAQVERIPVNRLLTEPAQVRQEGDVTIIPVVEEVLVVEKRLLLKEEIRITRRRREQHKPKEVTLKSEEARIERVRPKSQMPSAGCGV